ncbi:glycosyl transferase family 1 [Candidatus Uhrbacteria bacterium CG10_big_fil_rev_8_21_14_0_10_48_11]|uniref:Glycosyl transferase family 1 n=1 Tax=Candidatus Uhrbacteria bacterium CG10_big_fil_rev_8_21_14_0_10_48_11 TaxID=1975037 RepID=A0A2M8LFA4_9BACT|nr:MAG: glycosyl transferase family 1 [Candidatus Uhrbacteria bacterium CG10_big_fil_rev_8_21_14_0_10_48_11]
MKICLYLEFSQLFNGRLFRNVGTGLLSSYKNQQAILRKLNIPFTESPKSQYDLLQINTPWLRSLFLMRRARRRGIPIIVWAHVTAEDAREVFRFGKYVSGFIRRYLTYAYGLADIVLCPTAYTRGLLIGYGLPEEKLVVQSNAVDVQRYAFTSERRTSGRQRYHVADGHLVVGTVGLVIPRKGIATFLQLAGRFPNASFLWFGKCYSSLLTKRLPRVRPKNVRFTGFVEDIQEAFSTIDIFVFPSKEENEGMAILEAAAAGRPILVRDIPAYASWLENEKNCLKAATDEVFFLQIERLLHDASLRQRLQQNAVVLAEAFSLPRAATKMNVLYERLLSCT